MQPTPRTIESGASQTTRMSLWSAAALTLCLCMGCRGGPSPASVADYAQPPQLPAPSAGTYARVPAIPNDPIVAMTVKNKGWDASLSGAAAGLALDFLEKGQPITDWSAREAVWRAGYPYPISRIRAWNTPQANPPPEALAAWLADIKDGIDLGLVRARGGGTDIWVALIAEPRVDIGVQPRHAAVGTTVLLPSLPGYTYVIANPHSEVLIGSAELGTRVSLEVSGEWLFEIRNAQGTAAIWPVYVGIIPPELGLFDEINASTNTDIEAQLESTVSAIREAYDLPTLQRSQLLDAAAQALLTDDQRDLAGVANGVGYNPQEVKRWSCRGPSVESCLDKVLWNPRARPAFLGTQQEFGWALEATQGQLHVVAVVAEG